MGKGSEKELDPNDSYRSAMRTLIAHRFGTVWAAVPAAVDGRGPEGVHDVRVASRRLRAAMDVAADAFPASWFKTLHRVAKEITGELGEVRDRDVQLAELQAERERVAPGERPGIDRLIARIDREREAARAEMLRYLSELEARGMAEEGVKRFGRAATAPWMAKESDA